MTAGQKLPDEDRDDRQARRRLWGALGAWLAAGELAALLVGGTSGIVVAVLCGAGGLLIAALVWLVGRAPSPPRPTYVADHRPTLVFRARPPVLLPAWATPLSFSARMTLVGETESWTVEKPPRWNRAYDVDAPPGLWTLEVWSPYLRTPRLDVQLHVEGRLYVEYRPTWHYVGKLRWQPAVPEGTVISGALKVKKNPPPHKKASR